MDYARADQLGDGYQAGGQAWDPGRPDILALLARASHLRSYPIYYGSNHTFLVTLGDEEAGESLAVYKPARGEYPLYDFPSGTLYRREVAAYLLDRLLSLDIVPPTVVARGEFGTGSLQLFIESPDETEVRITELRSMAFLDVLLNNADRKADHCLPSLDGKLWAIDHGLTFHVQPKLRTVLWHFAGAELTAGECRALAGFLTACEQGTPAADELKELIAVSEWRALRIRAERILDSGRFPNPRYKPVPYRW
jgi:hypothetical protein